MKIHLLLFVSLLVIGCREENNQGELLARLKTLETEVAKLPRSTPVRWAIADREKIREELFRHARAQIAEFEKADGMSPEILSLVAQYDVLRKELYSKPRPPLLAPPPLPTRFSPPTPTPKDPTVPAAQPTPAPSVVPQLPELSAEVKAYVALSNRVAAAKAPVARIIERRERIQAKYFGHEFLLQLVSEYATNRFDVVVDASEKSTYYKPLLYQASTSSPTDVTEEIIKFFREHEPTAKR